jgi:predicted DnaQ family exonuclease/DinG family helicase
MTRFDSFAVIDLETTGLDPAICEIIELGLARYENGRLRETYSQLVKPSTSVPGKITALTGIDDGMVEEAPIIQDAIAGFADLLRDSPWIVGHNVTFDISFLRSHLPADLMGNLENRIMDTGTLARIMIPRLTRFSLGSLVRYFGIERKRAHRALDDCLATGQVYLRLISVLNSLAVSEKESVGRMLFGNRDIELFRHALEPVEAEIADSSPRGPGEISGVLQDYSDNVLGKSPTESYEDYIELDRAAVENHFLRGGVLSKAIRSYEYRPQQVKMAMEVAGAFNRSELLLVEAPTGIGKSIAYLLPAAWWASLNGERVIISTQTKSLQSQLFYKDIPQLQEAVGFNFKSVLLKGRGNYICLLKYHELLAEAGTTFTRDDREILASLLLWVGQTKTGDISECHGFNPARNPYIWSRISCEGGFCLGPICRHAQECFLLRARRQAQEAQVVVVNHHLTFADFASGGDLVRQAGHIIFDEAHNLERIAASYLGNTLDKRSIDALLSDMFSSRPHHSGFLVGLRQSASLVESEKEIEKSIDSVIDAITALNNIGGEFFSRLATMIKARANRSDVRELSYSSNDNICESEEREAFVDTARILGERMDKLIDLVRTIDDLPKKKETVIRLEAFASDLSGFKTTLADLLFASDPEKVYWVDVPSSPRYPPRIQSAPLEVGRLLDEKFYDHLKTAVFTSATLAVNQDFEFISHRLGLDRGSAERTLSVCLDSPFDIDSEVTVLTAGFLPSPRAAGFQEAAVESLAEILGSGIGKSMVLFTSHNSLRAAAESLEDRLGSAGIDIFSQESSFTTERVLRRFKSSSRAVLLGTDTFWEGVDLPGELLELLVLFKLPFTVPDRPWFKANLDKIEQDGRNAFSELSLPDAVVKFRQGFGRLIRSSRDRGCVVVLDSRIENSSFGSVFLRSVGGMKHKCKSAKEIADQVRIWLILDR